MKTCLIVIMPAYYRDSSQFFKVLKNLKLYGGKTNKQKKNNLLERNCFYHPLFT